MGSELPKAKFKVYGMDCADEVAILKRELGPLVGGEGNLSFDILKAKMTMEAGAPDIDSDEIVRAVARTGMKAVPWREGEALSASQDRRKDRARSALTAASGLCLLAGFAIHAAVAGGLSEALGKEGLGAAHTVPWLARLVYLAGILAAVWHIAPKAWYALRRGRPDMNLLMTVAVAGAIGIGEWFEAATVSFLFAVSLTLESWSVGRARRAVEALMELAPPVVRLMTENGQESEVPAGQVALGSRFLVKPGEKIPLDGRVCGGSSQVNQAPITGESLPVLKEAGDEVFAGTINGDAALEVESSKKADDTTLAHIIRLVAEAQSRRAPSEQWVEKFARFYTPAIIALAAAVLLVPPLLFSAPWADWIYRSLVLLVIGCPCALVISTPVSIVAALASSARNGVLVKGGAFMEAPSRLRAMAFDKTGTLTLGKPSVVKVVALDGHSEAEVLQRAASIESRSDHPLARAIVEYASGQQIERQAVEDFRILPGKGASGRLNGKAYWLGSHRYLEERGQETEEVHQHLEGLSEAGQTVVVIGTEQHVCGFLALADALRQEAPGVVRKLHQMDVKHIVMLTGDNQGTANVIAGKAGVDEVRAELLPQDKVKAVEGLVSEYGFVAMVGDGVNDAPAMGRASLGIAMGAAGSDAAIEAADIALMSDDLAKVPWLIRHSRRTLAIIRQNITLSIAIKVLFVALTFLGYASLWAAIAADMGVSLLVIVNAMRLLRSKPAQAGTG